jgi:hypothetical protein
MTMMMMMMNEVQTLAETEIFFFASIQTGYGSHSKYYPIGFAVSNP